MNKTHAYLRTGLLLAAFMFTLFSSQDVYAQPGKNRAEKVIKRNFPVLMHARKTVRKGKNYTGDFAKAVAHQRYARKMYNRNRYMLAIHHGRRARVLAFKSIEANNGKPKKGWEFTSDESGGDYSPPDDELDAALGQTEFNDEKEASSELDTEDLDQQ